MSLVIKKFADGGSPEVRTYKRGNDEVDLNAFVRQAEAGFDNWLDKANIKKKYKKEVRAAYQDMITRINDDPESFVARLGGGFTNTAGITNNKNGFDAYGIAAGYLGNTLRSMQVYTKPKVKSNKSKYKRDAGLITQKMQSQIWGDDTNSFTKLDDDSYDKNTGQRGLTNRTAQTIAGLSDLKGRLKDYYDFDSDEDYNHAIGRIDSAIASLQNTNPNDDWFALGQLGMTGMDRFFATGKERSTQPRYPEDQAAYNTRRGSQQFEQWISNHYPRYTGTLHGTVALANSSDLPVSKAALTEFNNKLNSFSNDDLIKWIQEYISNIDSYDINNNQFIRRIYPSGVPNFNTGQVIATILNRMRENGMLHQFSSDSTKYYIPGTSRQGAGYVWDTSTNTLHHMNIHDIPYWQQKISNEYWQSNPSENYNVNPYWSQRYPEMYPSHKEGGILKFENGNKFIGNIGHTDNFNWYEYGFSKWVDDLIDAASKASDKKAFADLVNNTQHAHSLLSKKWDGKRAYLGTNNDVSNYQKGINDNFAYVNKNGISSIKSGNYYLYPSGANTSDKGENWVPDNYYAAQTDDRRLLGRNLGVDDFTPEQKKALTDRFKQAGYEMYFDESDKYYKLKPLEIPDDLQNVRDQIHEEIMNEVRTNPKLGEVSQNTQSNNPKFELDEKSVNTKSPKDNSKIVNTLGELGADLMGIGRLMGSIRTNNRIARIVRESRKPKLHNTPEFYFPVTGAATEMWLRDKQGDEILSQSYRPFTSDPSLAAARMLEGQIHVNDSHYQGFIADDRESKRTQAEALKRQEDNIARRSKLANDNMDAIIENNQILAQLEAARLKQNGISVGNYLQEQEVRIGQRIADDRKRRIQFALQAGQLSAEQNRKRRINEVMDYYRTYKAQPGNENKTLSDFNYATQGQYEQAMAAIQAEYQKALLDITADVYHYNYPTPKDYSPYDISKYNLTVAKNGGILKPSPNQLIDKIIRKNESNT